MCAKLEELFLAARTETLYHPVVDLLSIHLQLLEEKLSPSLLASIKKLEKVDMLRLGDSREKEAFEIITLCLKDNLKTSFGFLKDFVSFVENRAQWDRQIASKSPSFTAHSFSMDPRYHVGKVFDMCLFLAFSVASVFGMHRRGYLGGLRTAFKRGKQIHVPRPDPEGRDWRAVLLTYAHYFLLVWQTPNALIETVLKASTKCEDALNLYRIVSEKSPRTVVQVGTFVGFSAAIIGQAIRDTAIPAARIHLIDPNLKGGCFERPFTIAQSMLKCFSPPIAELFSFHEGWFATRSHAFAARTDVELPIAWRPHIIGHDVLEEIGAAVDFAFVDGDHSILGALSDALLTIDYLAKDGIAVYHDSTSIQGVRMALHILQADGEYFEGEKERGLISRADVIEIWPNNFDGLTVIRMREPIWRQHEKKLARSSG